VNLSVELENSFQLSAPKAEFRCMRALLMTKKSTVTLFWCLFLGSLLGAFFLIRPHSLFNSGDSGRDLPAANAPLSAEKKSDDIKETPPSDLGDFIIWRKVDFEDHPDGYYTDSQYKSDWKGGNLYLPNTTQIQTVDGRKVLANFFPKGTWGRGGGLNQWSEFADTGEDITEIYWTFRIKYQDDFDWALGAKLPGVGFGPVQTVASGGAGPGIGNKGASLRLMQQAGGKLRMYVYHHRMGEKYGDDMGQGTFGELKRGEWQELTVRVVANENGKANGIMQVWLDRVLVASAKNIEMRTSESPQKISGIALNTFMGGGDSRFAPDRDQFMWMDDVYFWQYSDKFLTANPSVARGLQLHLASHELYTPISEDDSWVAGPKSNTSSKSDGQAS